MELMRYYGRGCSSVERSNIDRPFFCSPFAELTLYRENTVFEVDMLPAQTKNLALA